MPVSDILVSPARVFYAPVGTEPPDPTTVAAGASWGATWKELGTTLEPVSFGHETDIFELEIQQSTAPVRRVRQAERVMIETVLAEITGQNLQLVTDGKLTTTAAGAATVGYDEIAAGGKVDLSYYAWGFEGVRVTDANERLPFRCFLYRADAVLNGQLTFAKDAGAGIPIQIRALADTTKPAGEQIYLMHNVTAPKTA